MAAEAVAQGADTVTGIEETVTEALVLTAPTEVVTGKESGREAKDLQAKDDAALATVTPR